MNKFKKISIYKYEDNVTRQVLDSVICEYPLTIFLNDVEYATLLCTPENMSELVVGYLNSEHIITSYKEIISFIIDEDKGICYIELKNNKIINSEIHKKRYVTSGCSNSAVFYDTLDAIKLSPTMIKEGEKKVKISDIFNMMKSVNQQSSLFKLTGGVHIAALFDYKNIICIAEDIGRHNAVDKIVGKLMINKLSGDDKVMVVSGRISSEMILKCAKAKISIIVSRSAPMDKAVDIARKLNLTLIGFVRGKRGNIYSGIDRINLE